MITLRLWWLWLRHSYTFRWAHKPLCGRYRGDVIRLGKLILCRSCVFLYLGIAVMTGALLSLTQLRAAALPLLFCAPFVILGSWPPIYRRWPRWIRDLLRGGVGALLPLTAAATLSEPLWGLGILTAGFLVMRIYRARRSKLKRRACEGCAQLGGGVCEGYQLQARHARDFDQAASEWLISAGRVPGFKGLSR